MKMDRAEIDRRIAEIRERWSMPPGAGAMYAQAYEDIGALLLALTAAHREIARLTAPIERGINSHSWPDLKKSASMTAAVWLYILQLEMRAHGCPTNYSFAGWEGYYDEDYTPHAALEEDFNNG